MILFKTIGALGLLFIIGGILVKSRKTRNIIYIAGGICLEIYSIYIDDLLFVTLQAFFIAVAVYDLIKLKKFTKDNKIND